MGQPQRWSSHDALDGQDAVVRLWQPGSARSGDRELSLELTLRQLYECYYEPVYLLMRDSRPRNLEAISHSVSYWVRFTGDPQLGAINRYHCRDFVVGIKSLPGRKYPTIGNNTVRKHCGAIQAIFDLCGPPDRKHREAIGLYDSWEKVPYIPRPSKETPSAEDTFAFEEVQRLIDNADAARLPNHLGCPPGVYMRRIYAMLFNTSMRIGGLMGATWRHYHGDHLILQARVAAKGRKAVRIELNSVAQQICERQRGMDAERIFPWPRSWPATRSSLYKQHDLIVQCLPTDRQFAFHAVRKGSNLEIARLNPKACEKALGNTARVNTEAYTSRQLVAETMARLPVLRTSPEQQRRLFD